MEDQNATLALCPFCGGKAGISDNEDEKWFANTWWMQCDACDARGPAQFNGERRYEDSSATRTPAECVSAAVEAWNRRQA